jgi:hypothetical protein
MQRMPPEPGAELLEFNLLHAAGYLDFGPIIQVTGFGALKPDHFATFLCHYSTSGQKVLSTEC